MIYTCFILHNLQVGYDLQEGKEDHFFSENDLNQEPEIETNSETTINTPDEMVGAHEDLKMDLMYHWYNNC